MEDKKENEIDIKVNVDKENVEDTLDELNEAVNEMTLPNITIRNNQQVYVTINYYNATHKEYLEEEN